ncbi:MAG: hypothetical protein QXR68_03235 [Pyrobaculum sp.]
MLNINFRIEPYAYVLGQQYGSILYTTTPASGDIARAIYVWGRRRAKAYRY